MITYNMVLPVNFFFFISFEISMRQPVAKHKRLKCISCSASWFITDSTWNVSLSERTSLNSSHPLALFWTTINFLGYSHGEGVAGNNTEGLRTWMALSAGFLFELF